MHRFGIAFEKQNTVKLLWQCFF